MHFFLGEIILQSSIPLTFINFFKNKKTHCGEKHDKTTHVGKNFDLRT